MKRTKVKNQNAITLIALVITIIVLLILAGVSISMLTGENGIIEQAKQAVEETEKAAEEEKEKLEILENAMLGKDTVHKWTRTEDTFICSHCNETYRMGQLVGYTASGLEITTMSAEKSGLDKYYTDNGKYPQNANIDVDGNQIIEAQDSEWIVLGIEDTNKDGINETLLITSLTSLLVTENKGLVFNGAGAYNNGIGEINRICRELYSNSEYGEARGITIDEVNNALNYEPVGGEYQQEDWDYVTVDNFTTKLEQLPIWERIKDNNQVPNTNKEYKDYELNGYIYWCNDGVELTKYNGDLLKEITEVEYETIFNTDSYWLASRGVGHYFCQNGMEFGIGSVHSGLVMSYGTWYFSTAAFGGLLWSDGSEECFGLGIRPVVSLKDKLPRKVV